jgi:hypothetical protein
MIFIRRIHNIPNTTAKFPHGHITGGLTAAADSSRDVAPSGEVFKGGMNISGVEARACGITFLQLRYYVANTSQGVTIFAVVPVQQEAEHEHVPALDPSIIRKGHHEFELRLKTRWLRRLRRGLDGGLWAIEHKFPPSGERAGCSEW